MVEPLIPFSPMEPKSFKEAFDDPDYGFQIKVGRGKDIGTY